MRSVLILLATATLLKPAVAALEAAPSGNRGTSGVNKAHKQQRKALKQQQGAMKKVMGQHEVSSDQRHRFKHELKAQRQTLRKEQKNESRRIKESRKSAGQTHTTVLNSLP